MLLMMAKAEDVVGTILDAGASSDVNDIFSVDIDFKNTLNLQRRSSLFRIT